MRYRDIHEGIFLRRPNRFVAWVSIDHGEALCHVKNTGRCKELLVPGCRVYLEHSGSPGRKTEYDLVAVWKGDRLINMDSQAPNQAAAEFLAQGGVLPGPPTVRAETRFGASRFDFYLESGERRAFLEVKGVTLEENGVVRFPDAPTERGVKHLHELCRCVQEGYEAYALFVIQMKGVRWLEPNDGTHPAFGEAMRRARDWGVHLLAYDCRVAPDRMELDQPVEIRL